VEDTSVKWAHRQDFETSLNRVDALIGKLAERYPASFEAINLVGFSQGAALAGAYLLAYTERVKRLAMLSGFLPAGVSPSDADLAGVDIFIGHGSLDETVPEEKAQEANLIFQAAGGNVRYCLTEVGHKLGSECFRAFNRFFEDL
jgi:phospholipase/carboxylesterase